MLANSYCIGHNPDVYEDPFTVNPDRFLDDDGKMVEPGHPLRQKYAIQIFMYRDNGML